MTRVSERRRSHSKRRVNLLIVGAFVCFLAIQGFVSFRISPEPYPVIRMPGFQTAADRDGTVETTFVRGEVDFADGGSAEVDPSAVMEPLRFSTARPTLDYILGPRSDIDLSDESIAWLRERAQIVSGRPDVTSIRFCWEPTRIDITSAQVVQKQECEWKVVEL